MLSGGLDTVATQVAWFIALLSQHPEIQDKAVAEIRRFYSDDETKVVKQLVQITV